MHQRVVASIYTFPPKKGNERWDLLSIPCVLYHPLEMQMHSDAVNCMVHQLAAFHSNLHPIFPHSIVKTHYEMLIDNNSVMRNAKNFESGKILHYGGLEVSLHLARSPARCEWRWVWCGTEETRSQLQRNPPSRNNLYFIAKIDMLQLALIA